MGLRLSEGLGRIWRADPAVLDVCELPSWLEAEEDWLEAMMLIELPCDEILLEREQPQATR